jgi:hypothetical protein
VKWVLQLAKAAVMRHGVRGLVIDPYNELDHQRASNQLRCFFLLFSKPKKEGKKESKQ